MTIEKIKQDIAKIEREREDVFAQMKPLEKKADSLYNKLEKKKNELDMAILAQDLTMGDKIEYLLSESGNDGMVKHKESEKFFRDMGLSTSGYYPDTKQRCVQVSLIQGCEKSLKTSLQSLELVLPYIKPVNGNKMISIFEHTLSEYGVYHIYIADTYDLVKTTYGREQVLKSFNSLVECLAYIQKNHYYEKMDDAA